MRSENLGKVSLKIADHHRFLNPDLLLSSPLSERFKINGKGSGEISFKDAS
jgi:hypothetical protein